MHGRQREEYKAHQGDPKVAASLATKAQKWHALSTEITTRRHHFFANQVSTEWIESTLALTEKMLLVNPDPLYIWNFRRDLWQKSSLQQQLLQTDLRLTAAALENNPKAYGAWFHRKWILLQNESNDNDKTVLLQQELELTRLFLQRDERNFHCWNYRRFVVSCLLNNIHHHSTQQEQDWWTWPQVATSSNNADNNMMNNSNTTNEVLQGEWDFTTSKIQDNFSNFSAFHYRSKLLPWKMNHEDESNKESILRAEWELWQSAIFTEPDDQTAWWYARFLLDFIKTNHDKNDDNYSHIKSLVQEQVDLVRELAQEVPGSKWVILGLNMLLLHQQEEQATTNNEEGRSLLEKLITLDPDREGRYQEMLLE